MVDLVFLGVLDWWWLLVIWLLVWVWMVGYILVLGCFGLAVLGSVGFGLAFACVVLWYGLCWLCSGGGLCFGVVCVVDLVIDVMGW